MDVRLFDLDGSVADQPLVCQRATRLVDLRPWGPRLRMAPVSEPPLDSHENPGRIPMLRLTARSPHAGRIARALAQGDGSSPAASSDVAAHGHTVRRAAGDRGVGSARPGPGRFFWGRERA